MERWVVLLASFMLAACATAPAPERPARLFNDALFLAPSARIDAADVFALSDAMRRYANEEMGPLLRRKGRHWGLIDALYSKHQLKLEYDSVITRNASEAFHARSGNCLSLVIMTAAFAKEFGLAVEYQKVLVDDSWSRIGDVYLSIGHVNLTLARKSTDVAIGHRVGVYHNESASMTIDFLPQSDLRAVRTRYIGEDIVVAMYMNNRAVEALARGQLDDAYWWAREAVIQSPEFLTAYNTLGAIYQRHGNLAEAQRVLAHVFHLEPANTQVMSNLAAVLQGLGRVEEATAMTGKLRQMEPHPPFAYFKQGLAAMQEGDVITAREVFAKEVARAPYYHEFHYWLAVAQLNLGELEEARKHLAIAKENSTTRHEHDLYAAKLDRITKYHPR